MKIYDIILQGSEATEQNAIDLCNGLDWSEVEVYEDRMYEYSSYFDTVNGIDIYYDYGADYYYFVDPEL